MNTQLQTFQFQSHQLTVIPDEHGSPWFIAKEVAEILEYSDAYKMTCKLDDDEVQNRQIGGFGNRGVNLINESGLYSAILSSKKPAAKAFKKWVTSEVLPSIRKTGGFLPDFDKPMTLAQLQENQAIIDNAVKKLNKAQVLFTVEEFREYEKAVKKQQYETICELVKSGLSRQQIAHELSITRNNVRQVIFNARKRGDLSADEGAL